MKKYVVITGASSGIGRSTAEQFAKRGKSLILIARRKTLLEELKEELLKKYKEIDIVIYSFDLTQVDKLELLFNQLDEYYIETWINNAGFGLYSLVENQDIQTTTDLILLNVEALTILSVLYVKKYHTERGTQLINISSAGGYTMVPTAVTYCASKYYVSAFTEGLALELRENNSPLQAKVLAPAATKTEFGKIANHVEEYDYDVAFKKYHSSDQISEYLMQLYDSHKIVGRVDREKFSLKLTDHLFEYAYGSSNQKI